VVTEIDPPLAMVRSEAAPLLTVEVRTGAVREPEMVTWAWAVEASTKGASATAVASLESMVGRPRASERRACFRGRHGDYGMPLLPFRRPGRDKARGPKHRRRKCGEGFTTVTWAARKKRVQKVQRRRDDLKYARLSIEFEGIFSIRSVALECTARAISVREDVVRITMSKTRRDGIIRRPEAMGA
jgi:hypothetical protein